MVRHRLTDEHWNAVRQHIPVSTARTGRPARDPRQMLEAIFWVLATGAAWRDLPEADFGPWETVYYYFARWQRKGVLFKTIQALQLKLDENGDVDWSAWNVDGTNVRATRASGGAAKKVSLRTSSNLKITPWATAAADSAPKCIW